MVLLEMKEGLLIISPFEKVNKVLIPKSIPTDLFDLLTILNKSPSINIDAKYLFDLVFVIVTDLIPCLYL
jgi:hypothetical protein